MPFGEVHWMVVMFTLKGVASDFCCTRNRIHYIHSCSHYLIFIDLDIIVVRNCVFLNIPIKNRFQCIYVGQLQRYFFLRGTQSISAELQDS